MAAYPSYDILLGSDKTEESGVDDDYSEAGTQHSRLFHSQPYYRFRLRHNITLDQFNSLKADYDAGRRAVRTLTYYSESPAATYSVKFTGPPQIKTNHGNDRLLVESPLRGTKD
jgi:hypothetical protein